MTELGDGEVGAAGHHFRTRCSRKWTDAEPDTLTISVCDDDSDGMPFVVFTGSSTWLPADLVESEVIPWLHACMAEARIPAHPERAAEYRRLATPSPVVAPFPPVGSPTKDGTE